MSTGNNLIVINDSESLKKYSQQALTERDFEALMRIGDIYRNGQGEISVNIEKAIEFYSYTADSVCDFIAIYPFGERPRRGSSQNSRRGIV
jgi:hypothetical protein